MPSMVANAFSTMEGFSMPSLTVRPTRGKGDAELIRRSFLVDDKLPFANALSADTIRIVLEEHDCWFGTTYNAIFGSAVVLWAFLSQVLSSGKSRSCHATVSRIIAHNMATDQKAPAPDTLANQTEFPQEKQQKPGTGFPIIRACVILCMATACIVDAAMGPYSGKQSGEAALLRKMLLAYNLIRRLICQASHYTGVLPRRISFMRTCSHLLSLLPMLALGLYMPEQLKEILKQLGHMKIPDRPGRIEPRMLKRRRHRYKLMQEPRQVLREKIISGELKSDKRNNGV